MPNSIHYYQMNKHLYRERYIENKRKELENYEMFKKYGGEKTYYRNKFIEYGFIKPQKGDLSPTTPLKKSASVVGEDYDLPPVLLLDTEPAVAGTFLGPAEGLEGLTATDCSCVPVLVEGADPVVG